VTTYTGYQYQPSDFELLRIDRETGAATFTGLAVERVSFGPGGRWFAGFSSSLPRPVGPSDRVHPFGRIDRSKLRVSQVSALVGDAALLTGAEGAAWIVRFDPGNGESELVRVTG
jgi:hypothetical protein